MYGDASFEFFGFLFVRAEHCFLNTWALEKPWSGSNCEVRRVLSKFWFEDLYLANWFLPTPPPLFNSGSHAEEDVFVSGSCSTPFGCVKWLLRVTAALKNGGHDFFFAWRKQSFLLEWEVSEKEREGFGKRGLVEHWDILKYESEAEEKNMMAFFTTRCNFWLVFLLTRR